MKAQASLCICTDLPEHTLLFNAISTELSRIDPFKMVHPSMPLEIQ